MKNFNKLLFILAASILGISTSIVIAGPTVIHDDRVTNLATTPVLGRGYSVSTNTFQSICMQNIVLTQPSYDFSYLFQEMDSFLEENTQETDTLTKLAPKALRKFVLKKKAENEFRSKYWDMQRTIDQTTDVEETETQKKSGLEKTKTTLIKKTKTIVATINLHSYYASVDESVSEISDSAATLIRNNDILGFFDSCGAYYLRSIGRRAQFIALFEFESISEDEDKLFTYQLESQLKSFRKTTTTAKTTWKSKYRGYQREYNYDQTSTAEQESTTSTVVADQLKDTFTTKSQERNLTITASAFGLGMNQNASLISYDIETFKAAISEAFLAMQNPRTGKVDSIEVVPWAENTQFQNLVGLSEESEVEEEIGEGQNKQTVSRKLMSFEKKFILNANAEFLAEISRSDRAMMNLYYKAKLCKRNVDSQWKRKDENGELKINPDYADRYLMDIRYKDSGIKLSEFAGYLTDDVINGIRKNHNAFMYGGGAWGEGARACMRQLLVPKAIYSNLYVDIEACQGLEQRMGNVEESIIEKYCMPRLFEASQEPEEVATVAEEKATE